MRHQMMQKMQNLLQAHYNETLQVTLKLALLFKFVPYLLLIQRSARRRESSVTVLVITGAIGVLKLNSRLFTNSGYWHGLLKMTGNLKE